MPTKFEVYPTDRDIEIFRFVWKWKVVSTATLYFKFWGRRGNSHAAYNRLNALRRAGYLAHQQLLRGGNSFVWTLTPKSFKHVLFHLSDLKDEGFRSECPDHDHLASAVHIGNFLETAPPGVTLVSEQELRRCHSWQLPSCVPNSERHRPDGYWILPINGKKVLFALEMERTQQKDSKYELLGYWYGNSPEIERVIWVTTTVHIGRRIQTQLKKADPDTFGKHIFILLKDFLKDGWNAKILAGFDQGHTLGDRLRSGVTSPVHGTYGGTELVLLDTSLKPRLSTRSRPLVLEPDPVCIPL